MTAQRSHGDATRDHYEYRKNAAREDLDRSLAHAIEALGSKSTGGGWTAGLRRELAHLDATIIAYDRACEAHTAACIALGKEDP